MKNVLLFLTCLMILITNCHTTASEPQETIIQKVVFHYSYENFAWGHQQKGWYIDNEGNVWKMKAVQHWSEDVRNIFGGEEQQLSYDAERLERAYKKGRERIVTTIAPEALSRYYRLIEAASTGQYSGPEQRGADQGLTLYGCLLYDEQTNTYRKIILSISGDWNVMNMASDAKKINAWLKQIQAEENVE